MFWTLWIFRAFFGLLLTTSAVGKLLDNRGFAEIVANYQFPIPEPLLLPFALGVSMFELLLAVAIFAGYRLQRMAQLTIALHLGYTLLAALTILRGIELDNCGCFGVFLARPLGWSTVIEDALLTLLSAGFWLAAMRVEAPPEPQGLRRDVSQTAHGSHSI